MTKPSDRLIPATQLADWPFAQNFELHKSDIDGPSRQLLKAELHFTSILCGSLRAAISVLFSNGLHYSAAHPTAIRETGIRNPA
jgi:hypothetical protein